MGNDQFKQLLALLEVDPDLLHDFIVGKASKPELQALLSDQGRVFAANTPFQAKLLNGLFRDEVDRAALRDAVAACVDSCETSRLGAVDAGPLRGGFGRPGYTSAECASTEDCSCTNRTEYCGQTITCPNSCGYTTAVQGHDLLVQGRAAAGCDANSTCSCTSGTCGGATCGGSTCSATCTGDSCGNTCGDSCGYTTNLTRPFEAVRWLRQADYWR